MRTSARLRLLFTLLALALTTLGVRVDAQPGADARSRDEGDPSYDGPVLPPGREGEVLALLRPFTPGGPIGEGWSIGNVAIQRDRIAVELKHRGALRGAMLLLHPSSARRGVLRATNLAIAFEPETLSTPTLRARLVDAVRRNDRRSLWTIAQGSREDFTPRGPVARALLDGVWLSLGLVAFLALATRRHTRDGPRWVLPALLGVGALGLALRVTLSREAPMNAWPYSRVVPLAAAIYGGPALARLTAMLRVELRLVDLIFAVDLGLAALTPFALFVHARAVLRDPRAAIAAAALLATLPAHLRFSRSDVEFLQSLLVSSLAFTALYGALNDPDLRWRRLCAAALPALCLGTYVTRPENLVFFPLDLAAFAVAATGASLPRLRVVGVGALVAAPAAFAAATHLLARYRAELRDGLSTRTLKTAWETLWSVEYNTLINPFVTPPWVTALAALGFITLVYSPLRRKGFFFLAWLATFFVVHSYVRPHEVAMQARYHLHLVTPLLLLAASAAPWLAARSRAALVALGALTLATPWIYRGFVGDTGFYEMREFAFIREASRRVPEGCRVIEFRGVPDPTHPAHHFDSRWQRFANRLAQGELRPAYEVVTADVAGPNGGAERLAPAARALLDAPRGCVMVYLGLSCTAQRPPGTRVAPVCEALRGRGGLVPVAQTEITGRVYDSMNIGHPQHRRDRVWGTLHLLPPRTLVSLGLYRYSRP